MRISFYFLSFSVKRIYRSELLGCESSCLISRIGEIFDEWFLWERWSYERIQIVYNQRKMLIVVLFVLLVEEY